MNTRFARFINVPELMAVFGEVADIRTAEMLNLPVPELRGGKPRTWPARPSSALKAYRADAGARAEAAPQRPRQAAGGQHAGDHHRRPQGCAGFAAGDATALADSTNGKVAACAREVHEIWQRTAGSNVAPSWCSATCRRRRAARSSASTTTCGIGWSNAGLPAKEIAFIHDAETDAQKARLFKAVREGRVRVLLGSTAKMGIGTNVQTRLVALHELDCPWRPCDVEQREGRILRQGNECEEVEIFRYVTEGSFDAYSWQTLVTKAKFIAQVMSGDKGMRSIEDVELATLSYAEVKALASGNPKVIEKAGVDADMAQALDAVHGVAQPALCQRVGSGAPADAHRKQREAAQGADE